MNNKSYFFEFQPIEVDRVEKLLENLNNYKPAGMDTLHGRLINFVSNII